MADYYSPYLRSATPPAGNYRPDPFGPSPYNTPYASSYDLSDTARLVPATRPTHARNRSGLIRLNDPSAIWEKPLPTPIEPRRFPRRAFAVLVVALVIAAGVAVAVVETRKHTAAASASASPSAGPSAATTTGAHAPSGAQTLIAGGNGSVVVTAGGGNFTYQNAFGGSWYFDPANPFESGQANAQSPPLNTSWDWANDRIRGVNLGGWLVLEAFITPQLFQKYHVLDEWGLHTAMAADTKPGGGIGQLEDHYNTFITEEDFAQIAGAGLNWVRVPLPYWAIEVYPGEPFVPRVAWTYFLKGITWARKYGLRIHLDLHCVPGSQNGWNHSGKLGQVNFLAGVMGLANAQRTLSYIRVLTQFITQPQYASVIPSFGILNEPYTLGVDVLSDFYYQAYTAIREITGPGEGPVISIYDPFLDTKTWTTLLPGADRIALDVHPYFAFSVQYKRQPSDLVPAPCHGWASNYTTTWNNYGIITAGEWSLAINDCGTFVEQGKTPTYEVQFGVGACDVWNDYASWTPAVKAGLAQLFLTQLDSLQNAFFWTWKIAPATSGKIEAPFWSYTLGLAEGWIPADPSTAVGACAALGFPTQPALREPPAPAAAPGPAPPASLVWPPPRSVASALPTYTPTGAPVTLPVPTFTDPARPQETIDAGDGWFDKQDTAGMYVPVAGCSYPPAWAAVGLPVPHACATPAPA